MVWGFNWPGNTSGSWNYQSKICSPVAILYELTPKKFGQIKGPREPKKKKEELPKGFALIITKR
jgi:hypothetical protein